MFHIRPFAIQDECRDVFHTSYLRLVFRFQVLNNIVACVAGGRNKLVAAKAYDLYNAELREFGLQIRMPETVTDVEKREVRASVVLCV